LSLYHAADEVIGNFVSKADYHYYLVFFFIASMSKQIKQGVKFLSRLQVNFKKYFKKCLQTF